MKILHICMSQYSDGLSYQENMLAKYQKKYGHDVTVLTSMYCYKNGILVEDNKTNFFDENNVKVIRLKRNKKTIYNKISTYLNFEKELFKLEPDIIFSHGCQYRDIKKLIIYLKKHPNSKLYVDNHADFSNSATNILSKYILHRVIWRYYARKIEPYVTKFYGVLPARVDFLLSEYKIPKEKVELLIMGLDDALAEEIKYDLNINDEKKKKGIEQNDFIIITGGKIDLAKYEILTLMKVVSELNLNIKLLVFGSVVEELKSQFNSLLSDKIIYLGWLNQKEIISNLLLSDLAIFPGRHSVIWEQACGLGIPMVVKNWPGTHHIDVCGNVIFLKNESETELKSTILYLLDKDNFKIIKNNAEKCKEFFRYSKIAEESIR